MLSIIVAAAENGVIGRYGQMPWRLPTDLKTFRRLTMGKPVIMGRKTFQSIGKALGGRRNIVVSRDAGFAATDVSVARSLDDAIALARSWCGADEIMVIGGAEIYRQALPLADRVYLTRVHASPEGDATFNLPADGGWRQVSATAMQRGGRDDYDCTLVVFERTGSRRPDA